MKKIPPSQLQKTLNEVNVLFSRGNIEASEKILNELAASFPSHPEVLSKLGTIYLYQDKLDAGIQLIKKSLEANPYQPDVLNNYAVALLNTNQFKEALDTIIKAIQLKPDYIDAYYHQGLIYKSMGFLDEALKAYQKTIQLNSSHENAILNSAAIYIQLEKYNDAILILKNAQLSKPSLGYFFNLGLAYLKLKNFTESNQLFRYIVENDSTHYLAWNNLALSLKGLGHFEEALQCIEKATFLNPQYIEAYNSQGLILINMERFNEALQSFQIALEVNADDPSTYNNLALTYKAMKKYEEALKNYNLSLELNPNYVEALNNRGLLFQELKNFNDALKDFNQAIKIKPNFSEAFVNRGLLYKNYHLNEEALLDIRHASELDPDNLDINFNLTMIYLLVHLNFSEGWKTFEKRKEVFHFKEKTKFLNKIYLNNLPDSNDPILIFSEQGIGDQIIYLSLLHEIASLPNKIYTQIDSKLLGIFQRSFPKLTFLSNKETLNPNLYKYHLLCGSLPHIFRNSKHSFLNQKKSFLISDQSKTKHFREKLKATHKYVCGIAWKSVNPKFGQFKSIVLNNFLPIFQLPFVNFIDLQYGDTLIERNLLLNEHNITLTKIDEVDNFNDIDGLASLIDACDFIVTISNVTAHIAGALGKKVFLLVPYEEGRIWYWHQSLTTSLWYPSVQIFTQSEMGVWTKPITDIKEQLMDQINYE